MKHYITITCETPEAKTYVEEWLDDGFKNLQEASGNVEGLSVNIVTVGTYQETNGEIPVEYLPPGLSYEQLEGHIKDLLLQKVKT